ncbi:acetate kinase A and propionate kinase 2 [Tepidanaerobacter acetatoxydans Re1]|uniref:Acetate kinase n=1 Tax=Tepidanaerobacter acetatoxydans (strain DSM 21804 / JCM 16047 / Re1) TaxID=1209989 RepID=F4LVK7_TEPAE|nr:Acetate kinase [Tepidanaerobacter acetatoxydans Re1]CDI40739.1 acetate kinase A and propionate kinase 2 [Tepidanaerobacter acetatoxydans Re1]
MLKVLVINCGSSSLKYQLFNMKDQSVLAKGLVERIGLEVGMLKHMPYCKDKIEVSDNIPNHKVAVKMMLDALLDKNHGVLKDISEISAVGHRVVHGAEKFSGSVKITDEVMDVLKECVAIAPLHNPPNIVGIEAAREMLPDVPMVGVFDTAFHQTMPQYAYMYGLPYELYEKYAVRRYGFHGTSHCFVSAEAAKMLNRPIEELKMITLHLGNGSSITAIKNGKSIENSMGFTPLEGIIMGTRCGNIDPAIVPFIMEKEGISPDKMNEYLNKKCGVYGISGVSSDFRDLEEAAKNGNKRADLALKMFSYQAKKFIGSYAAIMNGLDAIVFTGGIGENSATMRQMICKDMEYLGIKIDEAKNQVRGKQADISFEEAKAKALVIPTNEELMIALDTMSLVKTA